jgi:hypothetical protein
VNTLIFLGSGASSVFGIPTMKDLVTCFEKKLKEGSETNSKEMYDLYQSIKNSLLSVYRYADLESVFSIIDDLHKSITYSELDFTSVYILSTNKLTNIQDRSIADDKTRIIAGNLLTKFRDFIREKCSVNENEDNHIKEVFWPFFNMIASKGVCTEIEVNGKKHYLDNWPIYTTNYDRVQELCWEGIIQINNLITEEKNLRFINIKRLQSRDPRLVHLHGSLRWYGLDDGRIVESETNRISIGGRLVTGEMVLYPINQKDLYLYPWFDIFKAFKEDLANTQNWIVIGYSFNDLFIREIFLEALRREKHRLIIVDPEASKIVEEKFRKEYDSDNIEAIDGRLGENEIISRVEKQILPGNK